MKTQNLLLTLALAALTGCVAVKPDPKPLPELPPLPPGYTPPKQIVKAQSPKAATFSISKMSLASASSMGPTPAETWVADNLYIQNRTNGIFLSWMTNSSKNVLLAATNISTPVIEWDILATCSKFQEGDHWSIQVTNRMFPQRFYRLLLAPTNSLVFGWSYPLAASTNVVGFKLYEGPATNTLAMSVNYPVRCLWMTRTNVSTITNRTYFSIWAYDTSDVESGDSNFVNWAPGDPCITPFSPPCP